MSALNIKQGKNHKSTHKTTREEKRETEDNYLSTISFISLVSTHYLHVVYYFDVHVIRQLWPIIIMITHVTINFRCYFVALSSN